MIVASRKTDALNPQTVNFVAFWRWTSSLVVTLAHGRALIFVGFGAVTAGWLQYAALPFYLLTSLADQAVIVFFVLSGFLVGGRSIEKAREGRFDLGSYSIDRISRIYAVLVPALFLTLMLDRFGSQLFGDAGYYDASNILVKERFAAGFEGSGDIWTFFCNLVQAQPRQCAVFGSNIPLWSLSYEFWFYAASGATAWFLARRTVFRAGCAAFSVALMVAVLGLSSLVYGAIWAAGALAYLKRDHRLARLGTGALGMLAIGSTLAIIAAQSVPGTMAVDGKSIELNLIVTAAIFAFVLHCYASNGGSTRQSWLTVNRRFADFSYTLYLIHFPLMVFLFSAMIVWSSGSVGPASGFQPTALPNAIAYISATVIVLFFAYGFAQIFERNTPALRQLMKLRIRFS